MTFEWALKSMRGGMKVRRSAWTTSASEYCMTIISGEVTTFDSSVELEKNPLVDIVRFSDLLAEDWEEYKEITT